MTQSTSDLFGQNATIANGKLTITLADLVDTNSNPYLADIANSTPSQIATAWIAYLHHSQAPELDENSQPIVDKTQAVVPQNSFAPKTYEVRDQEAQIRNEFLFAIYTIDTSVFDPDNVV